MSKIPINITAWAKDFHISNYGAREKGFCTDMEEGVIHYFKHSHERYPWEFWCEVIAAKLGNALQLDILDYSPAYYEHKGTFRWGSLSPVLNEPQDELIHGQSLLLEYKPDFEKKKGTDHSFQLICQVLLDQSWFSEDSKLAFYKMIAFDALICNRDRHQENWAVLQQSSMPFPKELGDKAANGLLSEPEIPEFLDYLSKLARELSSRRLAPIYDSGSSMGHNLVEKNLKRWMQDDKRSALREYAFGKDATAHIRWHSEQILHDTLVSNLLEEKRTYMYAALNALCQLFDRSDVTGLVESIDHQALTVSDSLPLEYRLSPARKQFITELLYLRHRKLCQLLQQHRT